MKVSLIIPVYNVRDYLRRCLDSVAEQTYKDLEVIVVNDGSTDDSLEIVLEYTAKYPNFQCYTIENRGLGGARNYGMERASGEYILFLDSDDYIAEKTVEIMVNAAEENGSDIVVCNCCDVREDGSVLLAYKNAYKNATTSLVKEPEILLNRACAWGKLYKRDLLQGFSYVSRVWYEDMRLTPKLYLHAQRITYVEDSLFYYVQRAGSIMNNLNYSRNLEVIDAFEDLLGYFREQGAYETYKDILEFLVIDHIAVSAIGRVALGKGKQRNEVLTALQKYLASFKGLYRNPYRKTQSRNRKIILWCNRCRLYRVTRLLLNTKRSLQN